MYKLLLSWRYLRTRYIALASIMSVTLGVATLIVVNSVMSGFTHEMHKRMHGILSDIVIECYEPSGMPEPAWHMQEIQRVLGDDVVAMTPVVHVPAMVNIRLSNGRSMTKWINFLGIDPATYGEVCDFSPYLIHPQNQNNLSFALREDGYDEERVNFPTSGWQHRRWRVGLERSLSQRPSNDNAQIDSAIIQPAAEPLETFELPDDIPELPSKLDSGVTQTSLDKTSPDNSLQETDSVYSQTTHSDVFDPMDEQHTGVILGMAICTSRHKTADGEVRDHFFCQPGDDVQIQFPNAGQEVKAIFESFTVVDLYESKMSEYDSTFAFVPLSKLQEMRNMFHPETGSRTVSSLQLRLNPTADLETVRDRLRAHFPVETFGYSIQSWRDMQGPLLAAVQMETTILNILLFLIIAVAGFGILATFFMIVVEKTRDIGVLKSLGAPSRGVMSIFLSYGFSLGIVGSGVGMVLGLIFVKYLNEIAGFVEILTGQEVFDPTIYYFETIPTITNPLTVVWVTIGAVSIAVLASILPAIRAARLHPVEALRYE